jgi:hypothetical protein
MDLATLAVAKKYTRDKIAEAAVGGVDVTELVTEKVAEVVGTATESFNTLGEMETAINSKVDKVSGKGLSTNDFTNAYKNKVDSALQSYTETDPTVPSWAKAETKPSYSYSEITDKPTLSTVATSGSYNDLTNKPTIPSIAGLATEEYVNNAVTNIVLTSEGGKKFKLTVDDTGVLTATEITE